jgi:hypothetical protein
MATEMATDDVFGREGSASMMANELAELLVDQIYALRAARAERDMFRLIATEAIFRLHDVARERDRLRLRLHRLLDEGRTAA